MTRRGVLLATLVDAEFPAAVEAGGARLLLNGAASRLWSVFRIEVYRAALYLPSRSSDAAAILASAAPRLVEARYRRAVPLDSVVAAWEATAGSPLPPGFRDWLRPISAGDVERQLFLQDGVALDGTGRPPRRVAGSAFARQLLSTWIGPEADAALRRGLLGLA